jgi:hypothetical protein
MGILIFKIWKFWIFFSCKTSLFGPKSYISGQNSPIKKLLSLQAKTWTRNFYLATKIPQKGLLLLLGILRKIYRQAIFCQIKKKELVSIPSIRHFSLFFLWENITKFQPQKMRRNIQLKIPMFLKQMFTKFL